MIFGDDMFGDIDNLKLISIIQGVVKGYRVYYDRPSHCIVFKLSGKSRYAFEDCELELRQDEIMFIPKGRNYSVGYADEQESRYLAVNFDADIPAAQPKIWQVENKSDFVRFYTRLSRLWAMQTAANKCRCMAILCEVLSSIAEIGPRPADAGGDMAILRPALEHLELNIFDPNLKIGELHQLCGISDTYFRKLFAANFGQSPKKYVAERRVSQAKAIIASGEYNNIGEVAAMTGFEDALYFSKVFKNRYGYPPSAKQ